MLSRDDLRGIIAEARLAPSPHNIQPTRWQLIDGRQIRLLGDPTRSLPAADPHGYDVRLAHGASMTGMELALGRRGICAVDVRLFDKDAAHVNGYVPIAEMGIMQASPEATYNDAVFRRVTWRGAFKCDQATAADLHRLQETQRSLLLVREPPVISMIADLGNRAALCSMRNREQREELLAWMRLRPSHPRYRRDGLNRDALNLSAIQALGAGVVLGKLFPLLDRLHLVASIVSEATKTESAAAIGLFHRPRGEDPFETGRHFYRSWLDIERASFSACPITVLADNPEFNARISSMCGLHSSSRLVNVFRLGRPNGVPDQTRARLPVDDLIVG